MREPIFSHHIPHDTDIYFGKYGRESEDLNCHAKKNISEEFLKVYMLKENAT